jgi:mono/diheme cytochrome c family protein
MLAPAISPSMKALTRSMKTLTIAISIALAALAADAASAQTPLSPDDVRAIERGKEIYKVKANCQFCHKWDASGDQGYGGNASSLRKTFLNEEQFAEVVRCGRPGTGINAPPITYSVDGKQYVAVLVGSRQPQNLWNYAPELRHTSTASMLYVFGLQ